MVEAYKNIATDTLGFWIKYNYFSFFGQHKLGGKGHNHWFFVFFFFLVDRNFCTMYIPNKTWELNEFLIQIDNQMAINIIDWIDEVLILKLANHFHLHFEQLNSTENGHFSLF